MGSLADTPKDNRRVLVIGAGPSGVVAAKYLKSEEYFEEIDVVERRLGPGGIWRYEDSTKNINHAEEEGHSLRYKTPIYDDLEVNVPRTLMSYSNSPPLASELPLFPKRRAVLDYLIQYARELGSMIQYGQEVESVERLEQSRPTQWEVTMKDLKSTSKWRRTYDAVVVASGQHGIPDYPSLPGLQEWRQRYPNTVSHSFDYDGPADFVDQRVLVVGNSVSGLDISRRLAHAKNPPSDPVVVCQRSKSSYYTPAPPNVKEVGAIVSLNPQEKSAEMSDGEIIKDIQKLIFCTGYQFSFPFLGEHSPVIPSGLQRDGQDSTNPGKHAIGARRTYNLYEYIFPFTPGSTVEPTGRRLAFISLLDKLVPSQMMETQASVIAGVFSGRLSLPSNTDMQQWEEEEEKVKGIAHWNTLRYPKDVEYYDRLCDWNAGKNGEATEQPHTDPHRWTEEERWLRTQIPKIRQAYMEQGEKRSGIKTIEELGFSYGGKR